jgi:hypothetical protein
MDKIPKELVDLIFEFHVESFVDLLHIRAICKDLQRYADCSTLWIQKQYKLIPDTIFRNLIQAEMSEETFNKVFSFQDLFFEEGEESRQRFGDNFQYGNINYQKRIPSLVQSMVTTINAFDNLRLDSTFMLEIDISNDKLQESFYLLKSHQRISQDTAPSLCLINQMLQSNLTRVPDDAIRSIQRNYLSPAQYEFIQLYRKWLVTISKEYHTLWSWYCLWTPRVQKVKFWINSALSYVSLFLYLATALLASYLFFSMNRDSPSKKTLRQDFVYQHVDLFTSESGLYSIYSQLDGDEGKGLVWHKALDEKLFYLLVGLIVLNHIGIAFLRYHVELIYTRRFFKIGFTFRGREI